MEILSNGRIARGKTSHLLIVLEASHLAFPFFFVALVPSDGGQTVQRARGMGTGLPGPLAPERWVARSVHRWSSYIGHVRCGKEANGHQTCNANTHHDDI